MIISLNVGWYLALLPAGGIVAGLLGRRYRWLRYILTGLGPLYAVGMFGLFLFASFLTDIGTFGVIVIAICVILSLAPIVSAWAGSRTPSVVATIALGAFNLFFFYGLLIFLPASSALLAAAIAGPPSRALQSQSASTTIALTDSRR